MLLTAESVGKIKNSKAFQYIVTWVILLSSLMVGVSTYDVNPTALRILIALDIFVTIFFVCEIIIRFVAEDKKIDFFKDGWNLFDLVIVVSSLIPSGGSSVLVLRLLRLARLLRVISFLPELKFLIESLIDSLRQSLNVLILIFIIVYIYGVAGVIIFGDIDGGRFESLGEALITMFQIMTLSSWETVMLPILEVFPWAWTFFISFVFISAVVILNLFVAILVDVVADRKKRINEDSNHKPS